MTMTIKISMIGPPGSGKTSLINAYMQYQKKVQDMDMDYVSSNASAMGNNYGNSGESGQDLQKFTFLALDKFPVEIEIEDTISGQEKFNQSMTYSVKKFRNKHGVLLVLDADGDQDDENEEVRGLEKKAKLLKENCPGSIPVSIILNKKDLIQGSKRAQENEEEIAEIFSNYCDLFNGLSHTSIIDQENKENLEDVVKAFNAHIELCISNYILGLAEETITLLSADNNVLSLMQEDIRTSIKEVNIKNFKNAMANKSNVNATYQASSLIPLDVNL